MTRLSKHTPLQLLALILMASLAAVLLLACESTSATTDRQSNAPVVQVLTATPASTRAVEGSTVTPRPSETPLPEATLVAVVVDPTETPPPPEPTQTPLPEHTETPVPQPTEVPIIEPTVAEASDPAAGPHGISIEGSPQFVAWTEAALALIQVHAPQWYGQVVASIAAITEAPSGTGINVGTRVMRVGVQTAYAPTHTPENQLAWFASTIVHDSCHSDRFQSGGVWRGQAAEIDCLQDQKAALLLLEPGGFFAGYVQGLIDGADDPANQYWNVEHRHW